MRASQVNERGQAALAQFGKWIAAKVAAFPTATRRVTEHELGNPCVESAQLAFAQNGLSGNG
jgi:hypothetical protein